MWVENQKDIFIGTSSYKFIHKWEDCLQRAESEHQDCLIEECLNNIYRLKEEFVLACRNMYTVNPELFNVIRYIVLRRAKKLEETLKSRQVSKLYSLGLVHLGCVENDTIITSEITGFFYATYIIRNASRSSRGNILRRGYYYYQ